MDKNKDLQIYLGLANRLRSSEKYLEKRKLLHSRIKLSLSRADGSYSTIGKILHGSGEFQKSLFPLKRATNINPQNTIAQICLANSLLKLGKENECFFTLKNALSISPREPALHSLVIKILKDQNRLDNLLSFYQETADMIQNNNSVVELYFQSAEMLENLKMIPQALEQYKKASESNAMRSEHYVQYAQALIHSGFSKEALVQFEYAWKLKPTNTLAINNIASLHYELGRIDKAFEVLEYIIKEGLQTSMTYLNLILVLEDLKKDQKVITKYRNHVQLYIQRNIEEMQIEHIRELRRTEKKLESDIDEKAREFYTKKLNALNGMASLLT